MIVYKITHGSIVFGTHVFKTSSLQQASYWADVLRRNKARYKIEFVRTNGPKQYEFRF